MNTNTIQVGADLGVARPRARAWTPDVGALLTWAKSRLVAVAHLRQRHRAIIELSRMSDSRLRDVGISRDRIAEVVDGLIAREGPSN